MVDINTGFVNNTVDNEKDDFLKIEMEFNGFLTDFLGAIRLFSFMFSSYFMLAIYGLSDYSSANIQGAVGRRSQRSKCQI